MTARSRAIAVVLLFSLVAGVLTWREHALGGDGTLRAWFFDIGQGDAALLVSPSGKHVVIDGGPDTSLLIHLGRSMPFFDREIELLILSHPHLDHLAAFPALLERYRVRAVLLTGAAGEAPAYKRFLAMLPAEGSRVILADPMSDIDFGDGLIIDTLWPRAGLLGIKADANNTSVVARARFGSASILFTGDMEEKEEETMLSEGIDVRADVLKVAHHASKTSSSTGFLLAVQPRLAVASLARDNRYGHPSPSVVRRFAELGIPLRLTMEEGSMCLRLRGGTGVEEC